MEVPSLPISRYRAFSNGVRILLVDSDSTCLKSLAKMLELCSYKVTSVERASVALSMLQETRGQFDLVIADIHNPDMEGFTFLKLILDNMVMAVILMSADEDVVVGKRALQNGACFFIKKPVTIEVVKNIWQHLFKKWRVKIREMEEAGSLADSVLGEALQLMDHEPPMIERKGKQKESKKKGSEEEKGCEISDNSDNVAKKKSQLQPMDYEPLMTERKGKQKESKRKGPEENKGCEISDNVAKKKSRLHWNGELNVKLLNAVDDKGTGRPRCGPKEIHARMNEPSITIEQIRRLQMESDINKRASHLPVASVPLPSGAQNSKSGSRMSKLTTTSFGGGPSLGNSPRQMLHSQSQLGPRYLGCSTPRIPYVDLFGKLKEASHLDYTNKCSGIQMTSDRDLHGLTHTGVKGRSPNSINLIGNMSKEVVKENLASRFPSVPRVGSFGTLRGPRLDSANNFAGVQTMSNSEPYTGMTDGRSPNFINLNGNMLDGDGKKNLAVGSLRTPQVGSLGMSNELPDLDYTNNCTRVQMASDASLNGRMIGDGSPNFINLKGNMLDGVGKKNLAIVSLRTPQVGSLGMPNLGVQMAKDVNLNGRMTSNGPQVGSLGMPNLGVQMAKDANLNGRMTGNGSSNFINLNGNVSDGDGKKNSALGSLRTPQVGSFGMSNVLPALDYTNNCTRVQMARDVNLNGRMTCDRSPNFINLNGNMLDGDGMKNLALGSLRTPQVGSIGMPNLGVQMAKDVNLNGTMTGDGSSNFINLNGIDGKNSALGSLGTPQGGSFGMSNELPDFDYTNNCTRVRMARDVNLNGRMTDGSPISINLNGNMLDGDIKKSLSLGSLGTPQVGSFGMSNELPNFDYANNCSRAQVASDANLNGRMIGDRLPNFINLNGNMLDRDGKNLALGSLRTSQVGSFGMSNELPDSDCTNNCTRVQMARDVNLNGRMTGIGSPNFINLNGNMLDWDGKKNLALRSLRTPQVGSFGMPNLGVQMVRDVNLNGRMTGDGSSNFINLNGNMLNRDGKNSALGSLGTPQVGSFEMSNELPDLDYTSNCTRVQMARDVNLNGRMTGDGSPNFTNLNGNMLDGDGKKNSALGSLRIPQVGSYGMPKLGVQIARDVNLNGRMTGDGSSNFTNLNGNMLDGDGKNSALESLGTPQVGSFGMSNELPDFDYTNNCTRAQMAKNVNLNGRMTGDGSSKFTNLNGNMLDGDGKTNLALRSSRTAQVGSYGMSNELPVLDYTSNWTRVQMVRDVNLNGRMTGDGSPNFINLNGRVTGDGSPNFINLNGYMLDGDGKNLALGSLRTPQVGSFGMSNELPDFDSTNNCTRVQMVRDVNLNGRMTDGSPNSINLSGNEFSDSMEEDLAVRFRKCSLQVPEFNSPDFNFPIPWMASSISNPNPTQFSIVFTDIVQEQDDHSVCGSMEEDLAVRFRKCSLHIPEFSSPDFTSPIPWMASSTSSPYPMQFSSVFTDIVQEQDDHSVSGSNSNIGSHSTLPDLIENNTFENSSVSHLLDNFGFEEQIPDGVSGSSSNIGNHATFPDLLERNMFENNSVSHLPDNFSFAERIPDRISGSNSNIGIHAIFPDLLESNMFEESSISHLIDNFCFEECIPDKLPDWTAILDHEFSTTGYNGDEGASIF